MRDATGQRVRLCDLLLRKWWAINNSDRTCKLQHRLLLGRAVQPLSHQSRTFRLTDIFSRFVWTNDGFADAFLSAVYWRLDVILLRLWNGILTVWIIPGIGGWCLHDAVLFDLKDKIRVFDFVSHNYLVNVESWFSLLSIPFKRPEKMLMLPQLISNKLVIDSHVVRVFSFCEWFIFHIFTFAFHIHIFIA